MPYISASDLVRLLPAVGTITGSSVPLTIDEVASITVQVAAELDGAAAAAGYAVPVSSTATVAYGQMESYNRAGAGWIVLRTVFPNFGGPADKNNLATDYRDAYMQALKDIKSGLMPLVGAAEDTGSGGRELARSYETSNPVGSFGGATPILSMKSVF